MREKLKREDGLTLVEMLAAVVILILLGLLLNTGLQMAVRTYRIITAQSEVELLLSTAMDALIDDLRYARDVSGSGTGFTYTSDSFGENTSLAINSDGQIVAKVGDDEKRFLATGTYGLNGAYRVAEMKIHSIVAADPDTEVTFTIELKVETTDKTISAKTPDGGVTVRCLNPK